MNVTFRCYPGLEDILPRPARASHAFPDWLKAMPISARDEAFGITVDTVKKCPPFIDAMGFGFLMPLVADVHVERCEFSWSWTELAGVESLAGINDSFSPVAVHFNTEVTGTPLFDAELSVIKFNNFWTIELDEGYSLLVTHPINRFDLPFRTLTGLVDADTYRAGFINFPAAWIDREFVGTLAKGTPVAQCLVVPREPYELRWGAIGVDELADQAQTHDAIRYDTGVYRREFRKTKK
ncbi:MAG: hypothetical protein R3286_02665 [Gammaproteobacteria bacterium]|nr:hypothetical protein [Gammaproteobacteria bacterium]